MNTASLKKEYNERIAPALMKQFQYSSPMQVPVLKKIQQFTPSGYAEKSAFPQNSPMLIQNNGITNPLTTPLKTD